MRADIRLWTAIVLIGICGCAAVLGWNIAQFSLSTRDIESSKKQVEARAWASVPGIASIAWQREVAVKINPSYLTAVNERREALLAFLSIKPLSSSHWLSLSGIEFATAQRMEGVLDALTLSALSGPNEGYVMAERGIFGLSLWEDLSADLKRRVAMDLAAGDVLDYEKFRAVLSAKSAAVRHELRGAVLATGLSPKEVGERLGL